MLVMKYVRNIRILLLFIFGFTLSAQSVEELNRLREAYEENKKKQEAASIIKQGIEDDGKKQGDPEIKLLVKPQEIKEYYTQKLESIRNELIELEDLLSYTDSIPSLKYFGYDFFSLRDSIPFADNIAVSPDYILGSGDEIIISLWGQAEFQHRQTINRDGTIFIENVGLIHLGGKTIENAEDYVLSRFSKVYSTLIEKPVTSYFNFSIGKVKTISVTVSGHVMRPGSYLIHPSVNVINLLISSGGIDDTGTMRNLKLVRNETTIDSIDLYPLLTGLGRINNFNFLDGDIILVPPRKGTIAITGAVQKPAYYEPTNGETAHELVSFAGGLTQRAGTHYSKVNPTKKNIIISVDLMNNFQVQNGDSLHFPVKNSIEVHVSIYGAVSSPGNYPWYRGITLSDILSISGAYDSQSQDYGELKNLELVRWNSENAKFESVRLKSNDTVEDRDKAAGILLQPFDNISIPRKQGYFLPEKVFIEGHITSPGEYPLLNKTETLSSLIHRAGGVLPGAFEAGIVIKRDTLTVGWSDNNIALAPGDSVFVPRETGTVMVIGTVHNPGYYIWEKGKPVSYYLELAGGLKAYSDKKSVVITYPNGTSAPTNRWRNSKVLEGSVISANEGKERPSTFNLVLDIFRRTTEPFVPIVSILVLMTATGK